MKKIIYILILASLLTKCGFSDIEKRNVGKFCKIKIPSKVKNFECEENHSRDSSMQVKFTLEMEDNNKFINNLYVTWNLDTAKKILGRYDVVPKYHSTIPWFVPTDNSKFLYGKINDSLWQGEIVIDLTNRHYSTIYLYCCKLKS